jgi:hypothetical protein
VRILWVHQHRHAFDYLLSMHDGHTETWAYQSRDYQLEVVSLANFDGVFTKDGYLVHGRSSLEAVHAFIRETGPWDAIVCYGPLVGDWRAVKEAAGKAVVALDYGGGPLCDLNGGRHPHADGFDHVFVAHETQARFLCGIGVPATKARGVPTNTYRPLSGVPKEWHVFCPNTFVGGKRNALVAQYCEQYAPRLPSLFLGAMEHPGLVDMTRCGGIPLNKPDIPFRNKITIGPRAPAAAMPLLYNASEFCVVGSQEEAGPWVALEAMACGVPTIVMADCGWFVAEAFAELERDFGGVRVVPPSPDAIHVALEEMRTTYAHECVQARRAIVERYDWFAQYDSTDRVLKNLAAFKEAGQG